MDYKLILPGETVYEWNHPSHLTLDYLKTYASGDIFVETGTYLGDTVKLALEHGFKKIHSIELNKKLYDDAVEMFKNEPTVKIWLGDSTEILPIIIDEIGNNRATFWLDAHASGPLVGGKSGGSPVVDELNIIGKSMCKEHTIFVDDKRLFGSAEWSYVSFDDAIKALGNINENYKIKLLDGHMPEDVICVKVL
jgi:hypothetical protein